MKRTFKLIAILCTIVAASLTSSLYAQDVTTFLGIPVDGYKPEMRKQLLAKGFTANKFENNEFFEGEFNGTDVRIYITTNNNKVCRLMICDQNTQNATNIKIRFNRLVKQFEKNERYMSLDDQTIDDKEDISYEITVHDKNYDAIFFQYPDMNKVDTIAIQNEIKKELIKTFKEEDFDNPSQELTEAATKAGFAKFSEMVRMKPVWFRIAKHYGEYYIVMYYDNEYNRAQGDDL